MVKKAAADNSFDITNKKAYRAKRVVISYSQKPVLEIPEAIIFLKYKINLWDKKILDIGCGGGRTTMFLKNISSRYTGIDYSPEMIEACKNKFNNLRLITCDVRDMSIFENSIFDFVLFSYNGIDCISHRDRLEGLREIHRVLIKDGLFVFSSHNINKINAVSHPGMSFTADPCKQFKIIIRYFLQSYNHLRNKKYQYIGKDYSIINDVDCNYGKLHYYIDKENQASQLRDAGFEIIEMYDVYGNILGFNDDDSNSSWIYYVTRKI